MIIKKFEDQEFEKLYKTIGIKDIKVGLESNITNIRV